MPYIGSEVIISPLGATVEENWAALSANASGISFVENAGFDGSGLHLSKISNFASEERFEHLVVQALGDISGKLPDAILMDSRTLVLISSTKGGIADQIEGQFEKTVQTLLSEFSLKNTPQVISNACISGVLAINTAGRLVHSGIYDHVIVIGCDVISDFVIFGFQSLFAVSDKPCAPFDAGRNGITLGEACAAVVVSKSKDIFEDAPLTLLPGFSSNDANHISGPSRTGEGLVRSVRRTLDSHRLFYSDIDFISAHGTATVYNDEMEAIAFNRLGLEEVPLSSLKGYFGHTLGAAGVIESAVCMQMIRNQMVISSLGFQSPGTSQFLNVVNKNVGRKINMVLKTASGFGGSNASLIIRNL